MKRLTEVQKNRMENLLYKQKILLLTIMSIGHSIVGLLVLVFIILFSLDIDIEFVDHIAFLPAFLFLVFNRCAHLDVYEYIKGDEDLPEYAKDGYITKNIQKLLFNDVIMAKSNDYRADKVVDISPFCEVSDPVIIKDIFNDKILYITINCIIIILVLTKYNMQSYIPLFVAWLFYTFTS